MGKSKESITNLEQQIKRTYIKRFILLALVGASITGTIFTIVLTKVIKIPLEPQFYVLPISVGIGFGLTLAYILRSAALLTERQRQIIEAKDQIKTLEGLLPICACCKKIRNDEGHWNQIENYLANNSSAEFSHAMCPECKDELVAKHAATKAVY